MYNVYIHVNACQKIVCVYIYTYLIYFNSSQIQMFVIYIYIYISSSLYFYSCRLGISVRTMDDPAYISVLIHWIWTYNIQFILSVQCIHHSSRITRTLECVSSGFPLFLLCFFVFFLPIVCFHPSHCSRPLQCISSILHAKYTVRVHVRLIIVVDVVLLFPSFPFTFLFFLSFFIFQIIY